MASQVTGRTASVLAPGPFPHRVPPVAGPQLTTGLYTASDARNVVDNCHTAPTGLGGSQYLVVVDAGFVQFYETTTATPAGIPPQPAQGQGTLSGGRRP